MTQRSPETPNESYPPTPPVATGMGDVGEVDVAGDAGAVGSKISFGVLGIGILSVEEANEAVFSAPQLLVP
jgi:hypothetical protein